MENVYDHSVYDSSLVTNCTSDELYDMVQKKCVMCMSIPLPTLVKFSRLLNIDVDEVSLLERDIGVRIKWLCEKIAQKIVEKQLNFWSDIPHDLFIKMVLDMELSSIASFCNSSSVISERCMYNNNLLFKQLINKHFPGAKMSPDTKQQFFSLVKTWEKFGKSLPKHIILPFRLGKGDTEFHSFKNGADLEKYLTLKITDKNWKKYFNPSPPRYDNVTEFLNAPFPSRTVTFYYQVPVNRMDKYSPIQPITQEKKVQLPRNAKMIDVLFALYEIYKDIEVGDSRYYDLEKFKNGYQVISTGT